MNHKNERILKLFKSGIVQPERIAKKTGLTVERVVEGLTWMQLETPEPIEKI